MGPEKVNYGTMGPTRGRTELRKPSMDTSVKALSQSCPENNVDRDE